MDESLIFQVPEVEHVVTRIAQIALRHDPKGTDSRKRPRFRSVQREMATSVVNQLALRPARQVQVAHEHIARIEAIDVVFSVARFTAALLALVDIAPANVIALADVVLTGTIANRR